MRSLALVIVLLIGTLAAPGASGVGASAPRVFLRTSCDVPTTSGVLTLDDCFTQMGDLVDWIHDIRRPTSTTPLLVDIGPGTFERFECRETLSWQDAGYISLRGAGQSKTVVRATGGELMPQAEHSAAFVQGCEDLHFQSLTLRSESVGVLWSGSGSSNWFDVEVDVLGTDDPAWGWEDTGGCSQPAQHFWFGSIIRAKGPTYSVGYEPKCSINWFYTSEIRAEGHAGTNLNNNALRIRSGGDVRVFGSVLRAVAGDRMSPILFFAAVQNHGGRFEMYGGDIVADAYGMPVDQAVVGIWSQGVASQRNRTLETSFSLRPSGGGGPSRVAFLPGGGPVDSPLLHPQSEDPPAAISSVPGSDIFVETDCGSDGNCNHGGDETHLMIWNPVCADSWFDSTAKRCRNEP